MKKFTALLLSAVMLFAFASCSGKNDETTLTPGTTDENGSTAALSDTATTLPAGAPDGAVTSMKEYLNNMEYVLYTNIFYESQGAQYEGQKITKEGTFGVIRDQFNGVDRYYVWGYADKTKCCDFQWELVMPDGAEIPAVGSYVKMTGTFTKSDKALDGYWFTDVNISVEETYASQGYDYDLTTVSPTLARVQIANMLQFPDYFANKTILVFGRALGANTIQHPYYNDAWSMDFKSEGNTPAVGQYILLGGTVTTEAGENATSCYLNVTSYKAF